MKYEHYDLLMEMVEKGYVSVQKHPTFDYYIYNYTQTTQFDKVWNYATLQSRGLILNGDGEIIARPFKKFFNIQEHGDKDIPWHEDFSVLEKVDGSLGIAYLGEDGETYIATRGSFTSEQATWATNWLRENEEIQWRVRETSWRWTYLFEIVYKSNRIVVDYGDFEGLIYLGAVDVVTGEVVHPSDVIMSIPGVRAVQEFDVSDVKELLSHTKDNFEGYVVRFNESGFTMKVKLDEYVRLHRLMTNVSNVTVWESLKNGDNIEGLLKDVPDEFYDWIKTIIDGLREQFKSIESVAKAVHDEFVGFERSYIAKKILHEGSKDVKRVAHVVFAMLDGKKYDETIWKMIRPEYQRPFYQTKGGDDV